MFRQTIILPCLAHMKLDSSWVVERNSVQKAEGSGPSTDSTCRHRSQCLLGCTAECLSLPKRRCCEEPVMSKHIQEALCVQIH